MKKYAVVLLFLAAFGGLIFYRMKESEPTLANGPAVEELVVRTVSPENRMFEETVSFAANVEPEEKAAVVAKVPGRTVLTVLVNEGDSVKKGQALATVDDSLLRQQIAQKQSAGRVLRELLAVVILFLRRFRHAFLALVILSARSSIV